MNKLICALILVSSAFTASGEELSHIITPRGGVDPLSENKSLVRNFYDALRKNKLNEMNDYLAVKYVVQDSNVVFDSSHKKYDPFSKNLDMRLHLLHQALPRFTLKISSMLAEGNKVLAHVQIQGIQKGPFLGIEPTDKSVTIKMFSIFTIEEGKISHINEIWNELDVMKQIGYIIL